MFGLSLRAGSAVWAGLSRGGGGVVKFAPTEMRFTRFTRSSQKVSVRHASLAQLAHASFMDR